MTSTPMRRRSTGTPFDRLTAACAPHLGVTVGHDADRGLTYTWHDQSPDPQDISPRESGVDTSALTAQTPDGACVAYLRISFTTDTLLAATFDRLLAWAEEGCGWRMGMQAHKRGYGDPVSPARLWQQAHLHAQMTPASLPGAGHSPWSLTADDAPTDPAVLEADLQAIEETIRPRFQAWRDYLLVPFVAYSHTDECHRGIGVGRAMYLHAAQQLAATGRVLRASGNQSGEAETLWFRLIADPTVPTSTITLTSWGSGEVGTYPVLDYR